MKYLNLILTLGIALFFYGCKKNVEVKFSNPSLPSYSKIYVPQAFTDSIAKPVLQTQTPDTVLVNGFLGGAFGAAQNIGLNFAVVPDSVAKFNAKYGTNYAIAPPSTYTIENADVSISAGTNKSGVARVIIKDKLTLSPFVTYLIPVVMTKTSGAEPVDGAHATVYVLVTASFAPGQVPRTKVATIPLASGSLITEFGSKFLLIDSVTTKPLIYTPDANGIFTAPPVAVIGASGWTVLDNMAYLNNDLFIGRWSPNLTSTDLWQFKVNPDNTYTPALTGPVPGASGWYVLRDIFTYKNYIIARWPAGNIWRFPYNNGVATWIDNSNGINWGVYKQIFAYQNLFIGIKPNGEMWRHNVSTDASVISAGTQIGTGWDMYKRVIISGTDLLAIDYAGDVWRYKFNPSGFWPLR